LWIYCGDEQQHPEVVFEHAPSRQRDATATFSKDYRGYLQADAFGGYDGIYLESGGRIIGACC
jgi:transposase